MPQVGIVIPSLNQLGDGHAYLQRQHYWTPFFSGDDLIETAPTNASIMLVSQSQ
jgi:hypothetical protein